MTIEKEQERIKELHDVIWKDITTPTEIIDILTQFAVLETTLMDDKLNADEVNVNRFLVGFQFCIDGMKKQGDKV